MGPTVGRVFIYCLFFPNFLHLDLTALFVFELSGRYKIKKVVCVPTRSQSCSVRSINRRWSNRSGYSLPNYFQSRFASEFQSRGLIRVGF